MKSSVNILNLFCCTENQLIIIIIISGVYSKNKCVYWWKTFSYQTVHGFRVELGNS